MTAHDSYVVLPVRGQLWAHIDEPYISNTSGLGLFLLKYKLNMKAINTQVRLELGITNQSDRRQACAQLVHKQHAMLLIFAKQITTCPR